MYGTGIEKCSRTEEFDRILEYLSSFAEYYYGNAILVMGNYCCYQSYRARTPRTRSWIARAQSCTTAVFREVLEFFRAALGLRWYRVSRVWSRFSVPTFLIESNDLSSTMSFCAIRRAFSPLKSDWWPFRKGFRALSQKNPQPYRSLTIRLWHQS